MSDKDNRFLRLRPNPLKLQVHLLSGYRIQSTERLIHQNELRIMDQCPGKGDPLLHSTGKLIRICILKSLQSYQLKHLHRLASVFLLVEFQDFDWKQHIVQYPPPVEEECFLENKTNFARWIEHRFINMDLALALGQ